MTAAPRFTAAQRRLLTALQADAEQRAATAGHAIGWDGTFTTVNAAGETVRMVDGWCRRCNRLRAVIDPMTGDGQVHFRFTRPDEPCPAAP